MRIIDIIPEDRLSPDVAVVAIMLDKAGFTIDMVTRREIVVLVAQADGPTRWCLSVLTDLTPLRHAEDPALRALSEASLHDTLSQVWRVAQDERAHIFVVKDGDAMLPKIRGLVHHVLDLRFDARTLEAYAAWRWPRGRKVDLGGVDFSKITSDLVAVAIRTASSPSDLRKRLESVAPMPQPSRHGAPARLGAAAGDVVKRLSEMHGFGAAKAWGLRLASDLRLWRQGELPWREVDRGALLVGPPGCGKSTFARAFALEVGEQAHFEIVTFDSFESGGSSYVIKAMRKKIDEWRDIARKGRPVVVFWDEIDSMGVRGENGHNDSYWAPIINTTLAFLDGAEPRDGIVLIAATNFEDRVDPALRRPGRLDRLVRMPRPGISDLAAMIGSHLGVRVDDAALSAARACRGVTPAHISLMCRDVRRFARDAGHRPTARHLEDLVVSLRQDRDPAHDRIIATHEAAHAVVAHLHGLEVGGIDVDGGDGAEGWAAIGPTTFLTDESYAAKMLVHLAGHAADRLISGMNSPFGVASDLEAATKLAVVGEVKTGANGLAATKDLTRRQAHAVERALRRFLAEAEDLVTRHRSLIVAVAEAAMLERFIDGDRFAEIVREHRRRAVRFIQREVEDVEPDLEDLPPCYMVAA